jgi:acetoin utilization protein AcuC
MWAELHALAHRVCGGRWLALGGGGYQIWSVVPRAWASLLAEMLDRPVDDGPIPDGWLQEALVEGGRGLPLTWLEDEGPQRDPATAAKARAETAAAVEEARAALFPRLGLRP